jgi:hypothetical protein
VKEKVWNNKRKQAWWKKAGAERRKQRLNGESMEQREENTGREEKAEVEGRKQGAKRRKQKLRGETKGLREESRS